MSSTPFSSLRIGRKYTISQAPMPDSRSRFLFTMTSPASRMRDLLRVSRSQVKEGDNAVDVLKSNGVTHLRLFKDYEDIVLAASRRQVSVFVIDKPPALYYLYKYGLRNTFNETISLYSGQFHRAVLHGNAGLLHTLNSGVLKNQQRRVDADRGKVGWADGEFARMGSLCAARLFTWRHACLPAAFLELVPPAEGIGENERARGEPYAAGFAGIPDQGHA